MQLDKLDLQAGNSIALDDFTVFVFSALGPERKEFLIKILESITCCISKILCFIFKFRVRYKITSEVKPIANCENQHFTLRHYNLSISAIPTIPVVRVSTGVSVWARQWGVSVGFPARDHRSLVGLMEKRAEYQLKGYKYLRAEILNNIRVGGPGDSSTHKMKVVA